MNTELIHKATVIALGLAFFSVAVWAIGQFGPPDKFRGFSPKPVTTINLSGEIEGMSGRWLRQVLTTVEPYGASPLHDHVDQPEIIYILKGVLLNIGTASPKNTVPERQSREQRTLAIGSRIRDLSKFSSSQRALPSGPEA